MHVQHLALVLPVLLAAGCAQTGEPVREPAPASDRSAAGADHFADTAVPTLRFAARPGWIAEEPATSSRVAQFRLPRADGDAEDARLVVYHFGGGGGTRAAVIERWIGQIERPDGGDSSEVARLTTVDRGGLRLSTVDVSGTYVAETSPGSGELLDEPGRRLVATMVECDSGPYFVKLVGEERTVERWRASYDAFLDALDE